MKFRDVQKNKNGFTLVEMMVAIAVFSIVMVTAMSALLNVISADTKARSIKTAINNISFALEGISKDMRMGKEYGCLDNVGSPTLCVPGGNDGVYFKSSKIVAGVSNPYIYYIFTNNQIKSCVGGGVGSICTGVYSALTSLEVSLTSVKFYVLNNDVATPAKEQPRAIITVTGKAGPTSKPQLQTDFNLQTSVSQRQRILN